MADRRPENPSPPTAPFRPVPEQPPKSSGSSEPGPANAPGGGKDQKERRPESDGDRPSTGERFAAALAATTARAARGGGKDAGARGGAGSPPAAGTPKSGVVPSEASPSGAGKGRQAGRRVRKARLRLTHIDPWSVMKTAFLLSVALGIVLVVAVAVVWSVLGVAGVWTSINSTVGDVLGDSGSNFQVEDYLGTSRVMGFTMLVAVVDVLLLTVIATLWAFLYNLAAALLGGVEVVLAEDDR